MEFIRSDALILLAVANTRGNQGLTLPDIIGVGEYIDHSIFSGFELRHGLSLLKQAGYIEEINWRFFLAGTALDFWAPYQNSRINPAYFLKIIEGFLQIEG